MRKKRIAVCDGEASYACRLMEYANQRKDALFVVHAFTGSQELLAFLQETAVDILLLDRDLAQECLREGGIGQVILLSEEEYLEDTEKYPVIYKFQSCTRILQQVMDLYAETAMTGLGTACAREKTQLIGVYSPIGRSGKTTFALALGKELGRKRKTLYLNLEEYSGFERLYPYADGRTLSELLYFLKQGKKAFACKLEGMVQEMGPLSFIPPLRSPAELRQVGGEDWTELLEAIARESRFEFVILDLGGAVNGLYEILERCAGIYTPVEEDEVAKAKLWQYEETLKLLNLEELLLRSRRFALSKEGTAFEELARAEGELWSRK